MPASRSVDLSAPTLVKMWAQFSVSITQGVSATALSLDTASIDSTAGAQAAISTLDSAIKAVSTSRATLGAYQNRLEHTINNLNVSVENVHAFVLGGQFLFNSYKVWNLPNKEAAPHIAAARVK